MKSRYAGILIFVALASIVVLMPSAACADAVGITLTSPLSGFPGATLTVAGNLANNDLTNYFFIADEFPVLNSALTNPTDLVVANATFGIPPFTFGSPSILAAASLSAVDLFTVQIATTAQPGSYAGVFQLYGDTGGSNCSPGLDCSLLSSQDFTVNVAAPVSTPEPSTWLLLGSSLATLAFLRRRARLLG
jgi:hypothetical protein